MPSVGFSCPSVQLSLVEASPETRLALLPLEGGGDGDKPAPEAAGILREQKTNLTSGAPGTHEIHLALLSRGPCAGSEWQCPARLLMGGRRGWHRRSGAAGCVGSAAELALG